MKTPSTTVPIVIPTYRIRPMNPPESMCFFGSRGGSLMILRSTCSTPNARAGNRSVPMLTESMSTAVSGVGRAKAIARNTVRSSPMLHENM